jgi:hypothetical protein
VKDVYLGISPFFHIGAEGHYERFHLALLNSLCDLVGPNGSSHFYFGAEGCLQSPNSFALVRDSFKRPDGTISLNEILHLCEGLKSISSSGTLFIYIYEGSMAFLLALKLLRSQGINVNAIVNLHQVELYENLLKDRFVNFMYRKIISQGSKNSHWIKMTSESKMSGKLLGELLSVNLDVFPVFSTFSGSAPILGDGRSNLILFSGDFIEGQIISDLEGIAVDGSDAVILDARFGELATEGLSNYLVNKNYQVVNQRISGESYETLFRSVRKVWFLYRAKVNILGSSGRLMDALNFGLSVVVPKGSALEEFALAARAGVEVIDLDNYLIEHPLIHPIQIDADDHLVGYSSEFAASELLRLWSTPPGHFADALSEKTAFRTVHEKLKGALRVSLEWFFLQFALQLNRKKQKYRRRFHRLFRKLIN